MRRSSRSCKRNGRWSSRELADRRNAERDRELSERATTDPLTGLLNTRWLREAGERELAQSLRSGQPLAILLLDLDEFKQINEAAAMAPATSCFAGWVRHSAA